MAKQVIATEQKMRGKVVHVKLVERETHSTESSPEMKEPGPEVTTAEVRDVKRIL